MEKTQLIENGIVTAEFLMTQHKLELQTAYDLSFDYLPVFKNVENNTIYMEQEGFSYHIYVEQGNIKTYGTSGIEITPENNKICFILGKELDHVRKAKTIPFPKMLTSEKRPIPPIPPTATPENSVFPWGTSQTITLTSREEGEIRYTLDGSCPTKDSALYCEPITIESDTTLLAKLFLSDGRISELASYSYQFGLKDILIESASVLDSRPIFSGNGIQDLLQTPRGSLDLLDGKWRATLQHLDIIGQFPTKTAISSIGIGFLFHHRSGVVYPEFVEFYTGADKDHLTLTQVIQIPKGPFAREIEKKDVVFQVNETIGAFRIVAHRYKLMPDWCFYHGHTNVFTMADNLIIIPQ